jgi:hypothetical protein
MTSARGQQRLHHLHVTLFTCENECGVAVLVLCGGFRARGQQCLHGPPETSSFSFLGQLSALAMRALPCILYAGLYTQPGSSSAHEHNCFYFPIM